MSPWHRKELLEELLELAAACPLDQCNPADCPLSTVRKLAPPARRHWFNALDDDDLEHLAAYHYTCMNLKLHTPYRDRLHLPT